MAKVFGIIFIAGGILTLIITLAFRAFASAMVGMSDSTTTNTDLSSLDKLIVLVCAYFFVSALGLLFFKSKRMLWACAGLAHSLLLIASVLLFFIFKNPNGYTLRSDTVRLAAFIAMYYLPWVSIWFYVLRKKA